MRALGALPVLLLAALPPSVGLDGDATSLETPAQRAPACVRGQHLTSGWVTKGGAEECWGPRYAHQVAEGDYLGLVLAPLRDADFFLSPRLALQEGGGGGRGGGKQNTQVRVHTGDERGGEGPWWYEPRQISRQDHTHFEGVGLRSEAVAFEAFLDRCKPLRGKGQLEAGVDIHVRKLSQWPGGNITSPYEHGQDVDTNGLMEWAEREGYSVILMHVDMRTAQLAALAEGLEREFLVPVQVDVHVTPPHSAGAVAEWADGDLFVLQVEGRSLWKVWDHVIERPLPQHRFWPTEEHTSAENQRNFLMRNGDTLYIPSGWIHEPMTNTSFLDKTSLYLTVALDTRVATWEVVAHAALDILAKESHVLQQDLEWSCASHSLTTRDLMHWAIRGAALSHPALREPIPMGKVAAVRKDDMHATFGNSVKAVRARDPLTLAMEGLEVMGGGQDALLMHAEGAWGAFHAACPAEWARLGGQGEGPLRDRVAERLVEGMEAFGAGAGAHIAAALDAVLGWSMDAMEARQAERRGLPKIADSWT